MARVQKNQEGTDRRGFLAEESCRPNQLFQFPLRGSAESR
jgi:hypothetical protein